LRAGVPFGGWLDAVHLMGRASCGSLRRVPDSSGVLDDAARLRVLLVERDAEIAELRGRLAELSGLLALVAELQAQVADLAVAGSGRPGTRVPAAGNRLPRTGSSCEGGAELEELVQASVAGRAGEGRAAAEPARWERCLTCLLSGSRYFDVRSKSDWGVLVEPARRAPAPSAGPATRLWKRPIRHPPAATHLRPRQ